MNEKLYQRYLKTSVYTDVGYYKEFVASLPDDIPSIGMLVCDQITHPSLYFTEPSSYLEETYTSLPTAQKFQNLKSVLIAKCFKHDCNPFVIHSAPPFIEVYLCVIICII